LKGATINGYLDLGSLTTVDKDFLKGTTINGSLDLRSLPTVDKDFLKGATINGYLDLGSLTTVDKDFLKGATINGYLYLDSLTTVDKDFLKGTTINGSLDLGSLTTVDKDFLKGATINGSLDLRSLPTVDKDFLKGTTINGSLYLGSLTTVDKDFLNKNVSKLTEGYNAKLGYCFFDGILSKVLSVHKRKEYTIYRTPFEFVAKKDNFSAHGKAIKKAIQDLEFKIISEKLKNEPIKEDTIITIPYYRLVTGACESGVNQWINSIFNEKDKAHWVENGIKAKELLPILEKSNAYGLDKFKGLIRFT